MRRSFGICQRRRLGRFLRLQTELRRRSVRVLRTRILWSTGNDRWELERYFNSGLEPTTSWSWVLCSSPLSKWTFNVGNHLLLSKISCPFEIIKMDWIRKVEMSSYQYKTENVYLVNRQIFYKYNAFQIVKFYKSVSQVKVIFLSSLEFFNLKLIFYFSIFVLCPMFRRLLQTVPVQREHQRDRSGLVRSVQRPLPEVLGPLVRRQLREVRKLVLRRRNRTKELPRFDKFYLIITIIIITFIYFIYFIFIDWVQIYNRYTIKASH